LIEYGKPLESGFPYDGAKSHYILDIEDKDFSVAMIKLLSHIIPLSKSKKNNL
jgi:hypothetical protein